jgi:hypothetical protein
MRTTILRFAGGFAAAAAISIPLTTGAQSAFAPGLRQDRQQTSSSRAGFPCGARLDPSYFQVTEGSGGHLLLLAPGEIGDAAALLTEFDKHRETIFRLAGTINPGVHEFRVPIDSSVESVLFSISIQCLQAADVARPSGAPLAGGEGVTDYASLRAVRMVRTVRPEPGIWTIRVAGSGVAGVMVQARSTLALAGIEFAPAGTTSFSPVPSPGIENVLRISLSDRATDVQASLVNAAFRRMASLTLRPRDTNGAYLSLFTPGPDGFRVMVEGKTSDGTPFQRVHAPLFTPAR